MDGLSTLVVWLALAASTPAAAQAAHPPDPDDDRNAPKTAPQQDRDRSDADVPDSAGKQDRDADDDENDNAAPVTAIVVSAHALDAARTQIDAGLGASVYALTNETIENRPGGETGSLSSILAQAPGVTSTGSGLTVRGSPANQIRVNNVIIPESISDPADHISARFAETTRLLTGTLPAQFGFAPAGVISVTTKNGLYQHGGEAEMFAGTDGSWEPALEWAGSVRQTSVFGSANYEHGRSTVSDSSGLSAEDKRNEIEGLAFADHVIGANDRVSMLVGGTDEHHHIGATSLPAGTEHMSDGYAVATYQHSAGNFTVQASLYAGAASDDSRFTGPSEERRDTFGAQIDATVDVSPAHTVRFGLLGGRSSVHELASGGDRNRAARASVATYVQDEWKITPALTFNPGLRVEWLRGFGSAAAVEPRASLVWQSDRGLSAHVGYSGFAAATPIGEERAALPLPDERDDYVDLGLQQRFGPVTLGIDAYERWARNYLAEYELVGTATPIAYAFRHAHFHGVELSATYARRGTTAWANLAVSSAKGRMILGAAGLLPAATLVAASAPYVPLSSDRPLTLSAGLGQRLGNLNLSGDLQVSSGAVRTRSAADPNGDRQSSYALLGFAAVYHAHIIGPRTDFRVDATDLTNSHAVTRDATSLEGGWTRRAEGRAVAFGIEQAF
ncbi:MAG TPA: TonB-dependent receptor [Sphingomicrobium sp.]|nr:TonB-dependent receptor [Sphingomicrobium sp.]